MYCCGIKRYAYLFPACLSAIVFRTTIAKKIITRKHNESNQSLGVYKRYAYLFSACLVAYRILLIIPMTVVTAERSFLKLKLIKNYLRSTMSEDMLNGLAMLSIKKRVLVSLDCSDVITNFALQKIDPINYRM